MAEIEALYAQLSSAKAAAAVVAAATTVQKDGALAAIADAIVARESEVLLANQRDCAAAEQASLAPALLERLRLSSASLQAMCQGLRDVQQLPDPVGQVTAMSYRPSGIQVGKMRVPLGVIGMIYEARPNVTIDAAALCLKSGNACILRGGSEAFHSNQALAACIRQGLEAVNLPLGTVEVLAEQDRAWVAAMLAAQDKIDLIVPRGGKGLIAEIAAKTKIPILKHLEGVCHLYIDEGADHSKAVAIAVNAKTHRYGVCNAIETLLIAEAERDVLIPLAERLAQHQVELRLCEHSAAHIQAVITQSNAAQFAALRWTLATEQDWYTEYLAPILAVKIVPGLEQAIAHINHYGSHHTDAIVTEHYLRSWRFVREVDSSSVMVNASTRFADGFEYGLGAEIGISTDKIHTRGPVGLKGLTNQKYVVLGDGHIRR